MAKQMNDPIVEFIDYLRSLGIGPHDPAEIISDDKRRRYRLEDDKPKTRNGSYQLMQEPDGFAVGWARSFKQGVTHNWHIKTNRKADQAQRDEWKRRSAEAKKARDEKTAEEAKSAAEKAGRIWAKAETTGLTGYMTTKGLEKLNGARVWRDMVVVPMRINSKITGLQFISADGSKRFLTGSQKDGAYHAMADKGEPLDRIVIAEGYATAAAVRAALGLPVIVAFDAGNLKSVAKAIHKKNPKVEIIFAADDDQWTAKPDGTPYNPGIEHAQQAAVAIGGGRVVAPEVPADDPGRRTDWDDIARSDGLQAIKDAFDRIPEEQPPQYEPDPGQWESDQGTFDPLEAIRPLGHNRGLYSFFPKTAGQIVTLPATALGRIQNLYLLAPRSFWEAAYSPDGKTSDSQICAFASAHLMDACHNQGIFQPENTRGVGAWIDGGVPLVNCGDMIVTADGRRAHPAEFRGTSVYESGPRVVDLDVEPATNKEASDLRAICHRLTWKKPQYGDMLAGWLVIAPIGAALRWRPHIWVVGRAGSGKSTIINEIVEPIIGSIGIKRDGGTTEAGVRKALGSSGRPFVLDEAEAENQQRQSELTKILGLVRGASSGAVVENANANFQVRSAFCLAAIIPRIEQVADKERITLLEVLKDSRPDRDEIFAALLSDIHGTITPAYSKRLLARTIQNLQTLLDNAEVFSKAASQVFGNKRSGDQIGPMLAGAYLLTTTKAVTVSAAKDWIEKQNWDWHTSTYDDSDAAKLVTYLMTARIRYDHDGAMREATMGDLVQHVVSGSILQREASEKALRSYGVMVQDGRLLIANAAPNMQRILRETPYTPWQRTLGDFAGATNHDNKTVYFMAGLRSKVTSLPLAEVIGADVVDKERYPFDEEFAL
jgi:putative DNA primase/helicase